MACLVAILALLAPRLTIVLLWIFSDYIGRALEATTSFPVLLNIVGFLFMPLTLLTYALAINAAGSVSGVYVVLVVIAVIVDLGLLGNGERARRRAWAQ